MGAGVAFSQSACRTVSNRGKTLRAGHQRWNDLQGFQQSGNIVVVSGPADIAVQLILGMHGPQELQIILITTEKETTSYPTLLQICADTCGKGGVGKMVKPFFQHPHNL
jgi:hypothetical protein